MKNLKKNDFQMEKMKDKNERQRVQDKTSRIGGRTRY